MVGANKDPSLPERLLPVPPRLFSPRGAFPSSAPSRRSGRRFTWAADSKLCRPMRAALALQATTTAGSASRTRLARAQRADISLQIGLLRRRPGREPGWVHRRPAEVEGAVGLSASSDESSCPPEPRARTQRQAVPGALARVESRGKRRRARRLRRARCSTEAVSKAPCYTPQTRRVSSHPRGRTALGPSGYGGRTPASATTGLHL